MTVFQVALDRSVEHDHKFGAPQTFGVQHCEGNYIALALKLLEGKT